MQALGICIVVAVYCDGGLALPKEQRVNLGDSACLEFLQAQVAVLCGADVDQMQSTTLCAWRSQSGLHVLIREPLALREALYMLRYTTIAIAKEVARWAVLRG